MEWLQTSILPAWGDPECGDNVCVSPKEYPGFGRFGCVSDCGTACRMLPATS